MLRRYLLRAYREIIPFIYARRNYKLFMKRSFEDLDTRISKVLISINTLPNIIKPIPIKPPFGKSVLVLAPHQDDEIIGCGGAMILQQEAQGGLNLIFVQDGGDEFQEDGYSTRGELVSVRENEACQVAKLLGIHQPVFLRHESLNGPAIQEIARELHDIILLKKIDVVFSPFILDYDYDHQATNQALAEAITGLKSKPKVLGYEVWGLCVPNVILNIDRVIEEKKRLLSLYKSQVSGTDYVHCTTGLNMYHSKTFGAGVCKYAERFFEIPGEDFISIVTKLQNI